MQASTADMDPPLSPDHMSETSRAKWRRRTCPDCGLTFARADTLKRHRHLHEPGRSSPISRTKTCTQCAKSKTKCDHSLPSCKRCGDKGYRCTYPDQASLRSPTASREPTGSEQPLETAPNFSYQLPTAPPTSTFPFNANYAPNPLYSILPESVFPSAPIASSSNPAWRFGESPTDVGVNGDGFSWPLVSPSNQPSSGGFDSNSLRIDSLNTFWSGWDSGVGNQLPSGTNDGGAELFAEFTSQNPGHRPSLERPAQMHAKTHENILEDHANMGPRSPAASSHSHSRPPSPAFFESDRLGQSLSKWNLYYNASQDDGDVLRGHRQFSFESETSLPTTMTLEALKKRWPILHNFTFDYRSKVRIVEAVIFSGISQEEQRAVYRTLSRLKDAIYLHFFSLYIQYEHDVQPFLHLPTLNPSVDNGLLSLAILSVGAFYSDLANARQFAIIMLEIVRRGCEHSMVAHPKVSRDIQTIQALLLAGKSRGGGEGREMETYERHRAFYCTILRRVMAFQPLTMPEPPRTTNGTEVAAWRAWIRWEQLKRTALSCWVFETDAAAMYQLGPSIGVNELELTLPCPEDLWEAKNVAEWLVLYRPPSPAGRVPIRRILSELGKTIDPKTDETTMNPYGALCVLVCGCAVTQSLMDLEFAAPMAFSAAIIELDAIQTRLTNGENEFTPWFKEQIIRDPGMWLAPLLTFHLLPLLRFLRPNQLLALVGRGIPEWKLKAQENIKDLVRSSPITARRLAVHAAQLLRLIRHTPYQGQEEGLGAYFSVAYLYMFIKATSSSAWSGPSTMPNMVLDGVLGDDAPTWVSLGYRASLDAIGDLASPGAAFNLLTTYGQILCTRKWSNDRFLGKALLVMAESEMGPAE